MSPGTTFKMKSFFSKIDLSKGFWQIMVEKSSQHLTAFSTTDGSYTFKKIPFGFKKMPFG